MLGTLVKQEANGKTIYLLNSKDMVALLAARLTHSVPTDLDAATINRRVATAEQTPASAWVPGDVGRLAKRLVRQKPARGI